MLVYTLMARSSVEHIRHNAAREDEGRFAILILTVFAALASLGAILAELGISQGARRTPDRSSRWRSITIVLSWVFIAHHLRAQLCARFLWGARRQAGADSTFPSEDTPDYWDFAYFSFVIGMTSQVSDVAVTSKPIRRTVNAHGIVAFFFNVALLALTVNIAASAI